MAIYHCSIKIISRGKGKSAVAAAAYRAGEKITNNYDGIIHDYTRKGGVVHTEILLPDYAPTKYAERNILWNAVEKIEKAKNSQLAREIELALPAELTREQNVILVREYVQRHFVERGMCADICVHDKNDGNPHAHVMLTMRPIEMDGTWGAKAHKVNGRKIPTVDWNDRTKAETWRSAWAEAVNAVLEKQKISERVDHRSYERQGIQQLPTVHMGVAATQMERRGIVTERGNINREIVVTNKQLRRLQARITELKGWLKEEFAKAVPPTLMSIIQGVLDRGELRGRPLQVRDMDMAKRAIAFLQKNGIETLPELRELVSRMQVRLRDIRDNLKYYDGRLKTLDEHIRQGGIYVKHKENYSLYQQLKPRKREKFFEEHRAELMVFEVAERYFKERGIGADFSIGAWKDEREKLLPERGKMYREYNALKDEVFEVESVRRVAEQVVHGVNAPEQQRKPKGRDLER